MKDSLNFVSDAGLTADKAALLEHLLEQEGLAPPHSRQIPHRLRGDRLPLSFAEHGLWLLHQLDPDTAAYNLPVYFRIRGPLHVAALEYAINEIVRRHEILRTSFTAIGGDCERSVSPGASLLLPELHLDLLPEDELATEAQRLADEEAARPFDLTVSPLLRAVLLRQGHEDRILLLTLHHIVCDGWSIAVLLRELCELYETFCKAKPSSLPELPIQYADYALWQRTQQVTEVNERQLDYWRQRLAGDLPQLSLPTGQSPRGRQSFRGSRQEWEFDGRFSRAIKSLGQERGCTPFMTLLTVFLTLLYRYTEQEDIVVGSPVSGRDRVETEPLIGFFVNMLLLRVSVRGEESFLELLTRVRNVCLEAYAHQDVPFEKLVEEFLPRRDPSGGSLPRVTFSLQRPLLAELKLPGLVTTPFAIRNQTTKFDLNLVVTEDENGLSGTLVYNVEKFDDSQISRMRRHIETLLESIVADPKRGISDLQMLTVGERHQLLREWNNTTTDYPRGQTFHALFEAQAKRTPNALAVVYEDQQLTYWDLNERANQVAHYLQGLGVGPEVLVALLMERSAEIIVALLGVLKAGGAYVPLDRGYPVERLAHLLTDSGARVVVTSGDIVVPTLPSDIAILRLDADAAALKEQPSHAPENEAEPENAAYVIYTSGSTGQPKGVVVEHRSLMNLSAALKAAIYSRREVSLPPRVAMNGSFTLDTSVKQLVQLLHGATLCIVPEDARYDADAMGAWLREHQVEVLDCTPAQLRQLVADGLQQKAGNALTDLLVAGESIDEALWKQLASLKDIRAWNLYGPTECTVDSALCRIAGERQNIGGPVANARLYVLDGHGAPVPVGIPGELYVGGAGVTRGYLGRPALTAERFVPDSFAGEPGARLYRTGDRVRWLADGTIEFLGRLDEQVKIRGFRIELGEIEAVLERHVTVHSAVVALRMDVAGEDRLAAYVVPVAGQSPNAADLRAHLRAALPAHMVPAAIMMLDALPLTPAGKLDRGKLPEPSWGGAGEDFTAPRTTAEEVLAAIWSRVLQVEPIGVNVSFFDLGGHSLHATRIVSKVRETFSTDLTIRHFFELATIERLAKEIEREAGLKTIARECPIRPLTPDTTPPLSYVQELCLLHEGWNNSLVLLAALSGKSKLFHKAASLFVRLASWAKSTRRGGNQGELSAISPFTSRIQKPLQAFLKMLAGLTASVGNAKVLERHFHIPAAWRLTGRLDVPAMRKALDEVVRRHQSMRTTFSVVDGRATQHITTSILGDFPLVDLRGLEASAREARAMFLIGKECKRSFDYASGLWRATLFRLAEEEYILFFVVHHLICDMWSINILIRELMTLYQSFVHGSGSPLPALPIQYTDFAAWQRGWLRGDGLHEPASYWSHQLSGTKMIPELELPFAKPRPLIASFRGENHTVTLPKRMCISIQEFGTSRGVTPYMLFLAALVSLLHLYTGKKSIGVQSPFANRNRAECQPLIGWFTNLLVLKTRVSAEDSFAQVLEEVREVTIGASLHQEMPFSKLFTMRLSHDKNYELIPKFTRCPHVFFDVRAHEALPQQRDSGLKVAPVKILEDTARPGGIVVTVTMGGGRFEVNVRYEADVFESADMRQFLTNYLMLLECAITHPERKVADLLPLTVTGL